MLYNKNMKFTLIVPFCNSKQHFTACLDSLLKQTYLEKHRKDVEIILVDNNSTDGTAKIATDCQKNNKDLMRVIKCKPWGAAAARNHGIREAKGEYYWCIDSDDWIEPNSLEKIAEELKKHKTAPDFLTIGAVRDFDEGMKHLGRVDIPAIGKGQKNWQKRFIMYGYGPWAYVARRQFILDNNLFFDEGMIHEDMALISSFVLYTEEIYPLDGTLYHYVQHAKSVLHRSEWNPHALDIFPALEKIYARFEAKNLPYADALEYFFIWNLLIDTVRNFKHFPKGRAHTKEIRNILRRYFPHWRKNPTLRSKSLTLRLRLRVAYWLGK